ncbi:ATP-binding protein [Gracilinema caldarium]|uniref:ATP-binding response regulator n=1 Tax=Gracilinema caldarium TaxID=215591 RepID=UPI0026ED72E2|nr:ATP-binding protein [Gracilinema caldarium]
MTSALPKQKFLSLALFGIAATLGFFLNRFVSVDMGFGITFLLGNIFGLFSVLIGPWPFCFIGPFVTMLPTIFLWGHPWALLSVLIEGLFVALLSQRKHYDRILLFELLYWPLAGAPLVFVQYVFLLRMNASGALAAAVKQGVNSIYDAVFALILFFLILSFKKFVLKIKSNKIHAQQYLVMFINLSILLPLLIGTGIYMKVEQQNILTNAEKEVSKIASLLVDELNYPEIEENDETVLNRMRKINEYDWAFFVGNESNRTIQYASFSGLPWYLKEDAILIDSYDNAQIFLNPKENNPMKQWSRAVVLALKPLGSLSLMVSRNLEKDVAFYNSSVSTVFIFLLIWLALFGTLTFYVVRILMRPLEGLRLAAEQTQKGLVGVVWPQTNILEIAELRDSLVAMTSALEQRNVELEEAKKSAERLTRLSEKYISFMGHELKSPLSAIYSVLDTMSIPLEIDIKTSIQRLLELIDDILEQARSSSGQLALRSQPFSPAQEARNLLEPLAIRARRRNLDFFLNIDPDLDIVVMGDPIRFRQILSNLVSNALKYTASGSIWVNLKSIKENDSIEIQGTVRDTGRGIKPEQLELIWQPFAAISAKTEDGESSHGLGLSIVREIINALHGSIDVSSIPGQGTIFSFRFKLPISRQANQAASEVQLNQPIISTGPVKAVQNNRPDLRGRRILVVEDEKIARIAIVYMLRSWGAHIDEADDGRLAFELWSHFSHDILIVDEHLNGMDGSELINKIRQQQGAVRPFIVYSSAEISQTNSSFIQSEVDAVLLKPVTEERLRHILMPFMNDYKISNN